MEKAAKKPSKVDARLIGDLAPYIGLVLVAVVFAILTKGALFTGQNLQSMIQSVMTTAICTIGAVFVFGAGYFDMSMGGSLCICAVIGTMATISTGSLVVGALVILGVSLVLAVIKGLLGSFVNVPFFIFTIILASIFSSVVLVIMGDETTIKLSNAVKPIPELSFTGMTIVSGICLLVFFALCVIVFNYTPETGITAAAS
ncbi:MAG: ABC transporter permease [Parasporobacterium sp.]|nr:ABC transporter permease [Parasporobacterium sp.]